MIDLENIEETKGVIFNIQHYSIHDGPGIRTDVFLKGCFLNCLWCQNPESQSLQPELFYFEEKCTGCGKCVRVCPERAITISEGKSITDRQKCKGTGKCAEICPNEARSLMGKHVTAKEVFEEVKGDEIFYQRSNGGLTLTGGDPLFQPHFSLSLLSLCKDAGINTAIETCGYARWEIFKAILQYVDIVLFDLKHLNPYEHQKYTGVSNELILENLKKIHHDLKIPILARIPIIPGYNDSRVNIEATANFISSELDKSIKVHLLAYHKLGETKYERLAKPWNKITIIPPTDDRMLELQKIMESYGLTTFIGG